MASPAITFKTIEPSGNLHDRVTRTLALQLIEAERRSVQIVFPNEADLCKQLGVSRSILREAVKVLEDKGLLEVRPRSGTRSKPRSEWHLLDPDVLCWQAETRMDPRLLRDLCEVRLAIEPTASGFAALRATTDEISLVGSCLEQWERLSNTRDLDEALRWNLQFHEAVVGASHNPLFQQLNASIRQPLRAALACTLQLPASPALELEAHRSLFLAIQRRDPLAARAASEEIVGFAMLAVEQAIRSGNKAKRQPQ
jgi:GntR family galactonate operon transcriptional repressor